MIDNIQSFRDAIQVALGYAPDDFAIGKRERFSTSEKRGDLSGWCLLFADGEGGCFGCWRLGITENWQAKNVRRLSTSERLARAKLITQTAKERQREQAMVWAQNRIRNAATWNLSKPISEGDPVALYFANRGLGDAWRQCSSVSHLANHAYYDQGKLAGRFSVMVAPITSRTGEAVALHRTYLTKDGKKADVPTVKKLTSASASLSGGSIKLFEPVNGILGVAEGIETALAASLGSKLPTQAAYSASGLVSFMWPSSVRHLVVFADHDVAGIEAAEKLSQRALIRGLSVKVLTPTTRGSDWLDVWAKGQEVSA
jgi:putative DNA primase/helicase